MLPDYPEAKALIEARLKEILKELRDSHMGPLRGIAHIRYFEGHGRRSADSKAEAREFREISAKTMVADAEVPSMTLQDILQRLDGIAEEIARKLAEHFYEEISAAAERAGTSVTGEGFTPRHFLDALSGLQIDFNPDGTPRMPEMHVHPSNVEAIRRSTVEFERDPELRREYDQIMVRKREEWRAREADRRLVG